MVTSAFGVKASTRQSIELRPRPPFRLDLTVWALRRRELNAIDTWDGDRYRRAVVLDGAPTELTIKQIGLADRPRLEVIVSGRSRTSAREHAARSVITRLLGLRVDLSGFYGRIRDPVLGNVAARYRGLKPPRFAGVFECLLNAVACQQLSLAAGLTLLNRLAAAVGPRAGSLHAFPEPSGILRLASRDLREIGFSERKADTILMLARAAASGEFELERLMPLDDAALRDQLTRLPGIGPWSADYVLLRGLGRLHVFPRNDVGALGGLRRLLADAGSDDDPEEVLARVAPDAGLLYFHLLLRGLEQRGLLDRAHPG